MVFDDRLYVIGGQEGDFMAKPGSPIFKCSRRNEVMQAVISSLCVVSVDHYAKTKINFGVVTLCFLQVVYEDVYMLDDDMKWKVLPPMPKPDSHIEFAWAIVNNSLIIVGGTTEKHPVTKRMILVGEVFRFEFDTQVRLLSSLFHRLFGFHINLRN